ncbi:MAG TPA: hypothetical protein VFB85_04545 [Vicinamibacterales bacterium]|jgi:hypothetical protein|nr:hypothetical protein [Vicinamibacterales bacterium]
MKFVPSVSTALGLLLAVPPIAVTLTVLVFAASERAGYMPLSDGPPRNLAEAAGMADGAAVLRMMASGDDPNRVMPIRPEIISSTVRQVTALEAAVWSRRGQLVRLLDDRGAIVGGTMRRELTCLARDIGTDEVASYLMPSGDPGCEKGQTLERVLARSRSTEPER